MRALRRALHRVAFYRRLRFGRKKAGLLHDVERALVRGAASARLRELDPTDPLSWEFCAFSQNGEDGILDYLTRRILQPNRFFIEAGAGDGRENNTSWLAVARRFSGIMIDADPLLADTGWRLMRYLTPYVRFRRARCTPANIQEHFWTPNPDVFSIDIDGGEKEIVSAFLEAGLRPAILVTEFDFRPGPGPIKAWRELLDGHGYRFVTVESNAVNAFFLDPARFDPSFVAGLKGADYRDNVFQRRKLGGAGAEA